MNVAAYHKVTGKPLRTKCRHGHSYDEENTWYWTGPDGRARRYCRACQRKYDLARQLRHRERELVRRYGITPADYDAMLARQGGVCAICLGPQTAKCRAFDVDHDHKTGRVRGLLCRRCNVGLTYLEEVSYREAALAYLSDEGGERPST